MSPMRMTLDEIKNKGFAALMKELGPVGYVRFMQQFLGRKGDYTKDRAKWIDRVDLSDLDARFGKALKRRRRPNAATTP
jgi:hypothetical protein